MRNSLQASAEGLATIDRARQRCGWTKTSTARWWQDAHTSRATLRRFWQGERIQREIFIAICQVVGISHWEAIANNFDNLELDLPEPEITPTSNSYSPSFPFDLDEAPDLTSFFGRDRELHQLEQWIVSEHCKLVTALGLGGIGKTTLALALADKLAGYELLAAPKTSAPFEVVIWRSLQAAPKLLSLLDSLLSKFSADLPVIQEIDQGTAQLLRYLRQHRCLLVLDGLDALFQQRADSGTSASQYHPGYEEYGDFLQRLSHDRHQSCILLTSRERPLGIDHMPSLMLQGLPEAGALNLLRNQGFTGKERGLKALIRLYGGNPLALKVTAPMIQNLFGGNVAAYLSQNTLVIGDRLKTVLEQQLAKLSGLEQDIADWLAIWQEPVTLCRLQTHLLHPPEFAAILESIASLEGRSLLEKRFNQDDLLLTLPPLVMKAVSDRLVERAVQEIQQVIKNNDVNYFKLLRTHCLVRPGTDDIAGDRLLAQLFEYLWRCFGTDLPAVSSQISSLLNSLSPFTAGYSHHNSLALFNRLGRSPT